MAGLYAYTPYMWPLIASALFLLAVSLFSWRRRSVPGAGPIAIASLVLVVWMITIALELAAVDLPAKIFWYKLRWSLVLVPVTAMLCFAIDYAGLGYRLTRRGLVTLAVPPQLLVLAVYTHGAYPLQWIEFSYDGRVRVIPGPVDWLVVAYGYFLSFVTILILVWHFNRSPFHRLPAGLVISGLLLSRIAFVADRTGVTPIAPLDLVSPALAITAGLYVIALFRFQMFAPIPVARQMVIDQMREGMLVLNNRQQIVGLNRAAIAMLGQPAAALHGSNLAAFLPGWDAVDAPPSRRSAGGLATPPAITRCTCRPCTAAATGCSAS